jgi:multidrug efflux pump subunit AcrB
MNLAAAAFKNKAFTHYVEVLILVLAAVSYFTLGKLEDPDFTVKRAAISTAYPGASAAEVELEVTDRLEKALQELPQLKSLSSISRPGLSIIKVDIKEEYWSDRLQQVWDEMRRKIRDTIPDLPPGCEKPDISDDFNFVFGFLLAVTRGNGYSDLELEEYANHLKKELSLTPGVSRVDLWGVQPKAVYVDVAEKQLATLGLTTENITSTLRRQNMVLNAGYVEIQNRRMRIAPSGEFGNVSEIGELLLRPAGLESMQSGATGVIQPTTSPTGQLIRIRDVATVSRGYLDPPPTVMRYNGLPAIGIAIANVAGGNVPNTGKRLDQQLERLVDELPYGIEVHRVAWQSDLVDESIQSFMHAFRDALIIVLVVVTLALGLRLGFVVGMGLLLSVGGVIIFMAVTGTALHRMSLGALIVALGMIVDDIIVVSDLYLVNLGKGMDKEEAAIHAATYNAKPLFWGTTAAAFAFFPIYVCVANAGEYCQTLFTVVGASLWISWIMAMTLTPVRCVQFLSKVRPKEGPGWMVRSLQRVPLLGRVISSKSPVGEDEPAGEGRLMNMLRWMIESGIRHKIVPLGLAVIILAWTAFSFGHVKKMFFPDAARPQLMVDLWAPQGEQHLMGNEHVDNVTAFIGAGPPRFYLPVDSESAYPEYAQLIVNTHSTHDVDALVAHLTQWLKEDYGHVLTRVRRYGVGPADTWKFELRISGPAEADLELLRDFGNRGADILRQSPLATDIQLDMRQRTLKIVPQYVQSRGRWTGVSREDVADTAKLAQDGITVGLYREGDDLYPIVMRKTATERARLASSFESLQVIPSMSTTRVPMGAVIEDVTPVWEDPIISRFNRRRCVTIQASPIDGETFPELRKRVLGDFKKLEETLPPGYEFFWDGEFDSTKTSQLALLPGVIPAVLVMVSILVYLFNGYRTPLVILLTLPFGMSGIVAGLLIFDMPFGFVALLGAMSLGGIMLRNSVVLLETIDHLLAEGKTRYEAIVEGALSRARPVAVAAATCGLGLIPLLADVFWSSMAAAMLCGVMVGTVLTLVVAPVLYATLFGIRSPHSANQS